VADAVPTSGAGKSGDPGGGVAELDDKPTDRPAIGEYPRVAAPILLQTEIAVATAAAAEFDAELMSPLFHAGVLITEQAQRVDAHRRRHRWWRLPFGPAAAASAAA
jgi:hypothetical protein